MRWKSAAVGCNLFSGWGVGVVMQWKKWHWRDTTSPKCTDLCWIFHIWKAGLGSVNRSSNIFSKCGCGFSSEPFLQPRFQITSHDHVFVGLIHSFADAHWWNCLAFSGWDQHDHVLYFKMKLQPSPLENSQKINQYFLRKKNKLMESRASKHSARWAQLETNTYLCSDAQFHELLCVNLWWDTLACSCTR